MLINFDVLPEGTTLSNQLPGVTFPGSPRIVRPQLGTSSGVQALTNLEPGEEFDREPLVIEFNAPQRFARLHTGLDGTSNGPVQATLRAFDSAGNEVAVDGPVSIGPGPTMIRTAMAVEITAPQIVRVTLKFDGAFAEVIDQLEFDSVAPGTDDNSPPALRVVEPVDGARVTGEFVLLSVQIDEAESLREVRLTITNSTGTTDFPLSFSGAAPSFTVGPVMTGPIVLGNNTLAITAEDGGGNTVQQTLSIRRVPVSGRLVVPDTVVAVRRGAPNAASSLTVRLEETFDGSLDGRDDIRIRVVAPPELRGSVVLPDAFNQPDPSVRLPLFAIPGSEPGTRCVDIEAHELDGNRLIDRATFVASVVPQRPTACRGDTAMLYARVPLEELTRVINRAVDALAAADDRISTLSSMRVTYTNGTIAFSQRYRAEWDVARFVSATINFASEIAVRIDGRRLRFSWQPFRVNASPNVPVISLPTAIAWRFAQGRFESEFTAAFKDPFLRQLEIGINQQMEQVDPNAGAFLRDVFVKPGEFAIGFCIPQSVFPRPDCGSPVSPTDPFQPAPDVGRVLG